MKPLLILLAGLACSGALSGCLDPAIRVRGVDEPISPAPMGDEPPHEGIAVGEPHPGAPGGISLARWYVVATGEWCRFDERAFDGRVFGDPESFNRTWAEQLACEPDSDRKALAPISWDDQFRVALIAPASGCVGAKLEVQDVDTSGDHYVVLYRFEPPAEGDACATAMSRPVVYLEVFRAFGDELEVEFRAL
jgi:hypothetical protein